MSKSKQKRNTTLYLTQAAVIAALYAALTYAASFMGLAYGSVQFRFSEALTVLAVFTPAALPGLCVGCFIGNLGSPLGVLDVFLGTAATFLAAYCSYATRHFGGKPGYLLAPLFSTVFNGVIIGLEAALFLPEGISWAGVAVSGLQVAAGEAAVCVALGIPLRVLLVRSGTAKRIFKC